MNPPFQLRSYLQADLCQAVRLQGGDPTSLSVARLWFGLLSPRFGPVLLCRLTYWLALKGLKPIARLVSLINFVAFGVEIALQADIGPGLFFPHSQGIVIGSWRIGKNSVIYQGVTLGAKERDFAYNEHSRPTLGDNVTVGAGAKVLGGVEIGTGARVGANAVVVTSIPPNAVAVGVPAKVIDT